MFIFALATEFEGGIYLSRSCQIKNILVESGSSREMDRQDIRRGRRRRRRINIINYFSFVTLLLSPALMSSQVSWEFSKNSVSVLMFFVAGLVER